MSTSQDLAAALTGITSRLDKIDQGLKENATKEDVTRVQETLTRLDDQVAKNKEDVAWLIRTKQDDTKHLEQKIGECVRDEIGKLRMEGSCNQRVEDIKKLEEADYNDARQSMRMWPIPDGDETVKKATRDFMCNILDIPRLSVARIRINFVRRVSGARRSKIEKEVLVRFADTGDRDTVQSYAPNLARHGGKAGVRFEIPNHLRHIFRLLDAHGGELKKRHPSLKRSIKFDDAARSFVLDVKIAEDEAWTRIDPRMAEESRRLRDANGRQAVIGRASPGGKAGRRVLMLPSPGKENRTAFGQG